MTSKSWITVTLVFSRAARDVSEQTWKVPAGTTLGQALATLQAHTVLGGWELSEFSLGIWGRKAISTEVAIGLVEPTGRGVAVHDEVAGGIESMRPTRGRGQRHLGIDCGQTRSDRKQRQGAAVVVAKVGQTIEWTDAYVNGGKVVKG